MPTYIGKTTDRSINPADFDEFSITVPLDPRLPGGGGYVISGLYDIQQEKFAARFAKIGIKLDF